MTLTRNGKIAFAAVIACVCAALIAVTVYATNASAFWMVSNEVHTEADSHGAVEISCIVDETAIGGGVYSDQIFVPTDSTADACLDEMYVENDDDSTPAMMHNHDYGTLREWLQGHTYTVSVYEGFTQKPGTQTTFDTEPIGDANTALNRYDAVVITVTK